MKTITITLHCSIMDAKHGRIEVCEIEPLEFCNIWLKCGPETEAFKRINYEFDADTFDWKKIKIEPFLKYLPPITSIPVTSNAQWLPSIPPWTTELPTIDGWYWVKAKDGACWINEVYALDGRLFFDSECSDSVEKYTLFQFSGPIPQPQ